MQFSNGSPPPRLAFSAYAVSPVRGTEPGNSWRVAAGLAERGVEVELVTTAMYRDEWQDAAANAGIRVTVVSDEVPWQSDRERLSYGRYVAFQRRSVSAVKRLADERPLDLVHHFSWGSLVWGTPLWRCGIPTVFGPTGGGSVSPKELMGLYDRRTAWSERARTAAVRATVLNPLARSTAKHCSVIAANRDTQRLAIRLSGNREILCFPETATDASLLATTPITPASQREMDSIIWLGRLESRKGFEIALRTLKELPEHTRLVVVGDGPGFDDARRKTASLRLADRVEFRGRVPWYSIPLLLDSAAVMLFTSIRDTFGAQLLEAGARGTPIVAIRHQGVADFVPDAAGALVPLDTAAAVARSMAMQINDLLTNADRWNASSAAVRQFAESHALPRQLDQFLALYGDLSSAFARSTVELRVTDEKSDDGPPTPS
jgi:glycosyltransferase involved in cell wall biosynthesis